MKPTSLLEQVDNYGHLSRWWQPVV